MKTATVTMMTIFLIIALSCVIAQEFAIHLLYNRCESLSSAYKQLALSKTKILYIPYMENGIPPTVYSPIDSPINAIMLAIKDRHPLSIKKIASDKIWE